MKFQAVLAHAGDLRKELVTYSPQSAAWGRLSRSPAALAYSQQRPQCLLFFSSYVNAQRGCWLTEVTEPRNTQ